MLWLSIAGLCGRSDIEDWGRRRFLLEVLALLRERPPLEEACRGLVPGGMWKCWVLAHLFLSYGGSDSFRPLRETTEAATGSLFSRGRAGLDWSSGFTAKLRGKVLLSP